MTRRALGISSFFLQGLQSSSLATAPAPVLERDPSAIEDLGGCLVEYMAKVRALEQVSQELEAQLRTHLESRAERSEGWGALRASWASSCQQVSASARAQGLCRGSRRGCRLLPFAPSLGGHYQRTSRLRPVARGKWSEAKETDHNLLHFHAKNTNGNNNGNKCGVLGARPTRVPLRALSPLMFTAVLCGGSFTDGAIQIRKRGHTKKRFFGQDHAASRVMELRFEPEFFWLQSLLWSHYLGLPLLLLC